MVAATEVATAVATDVVTVTDVDVAVAVTMADVARRVMDAVMMVVIHVVRTEVRLHERRVGSHAAVPSTASAAVWPAHPHGGTEHEIEREESARKHE